MQQKPQVSTIIGLLKPYFEMKSQPKTCASNSISESTDHTSCQNSPIDQFGFYIDRCLTDQKNMEIIISEILNNRAICAWNRQPHERLKNLIREFGIPHDLRPKIWLSFIHNEISNEYNVSVNCSRFFCAF